MYYQSIFFGYGLRPFCLFAFLPFCLFAFLDLSGLVDLLGPVVLLGLFSIYSNYKNRKRGHDECPRTGLKFSNHLNLILKLHPYAGYSFNDNL